MLELPTKPYFTPITSAKKYVNYLVEFSGEPSCTPPEAVIITFAQSHLNKLLASCEMKNSQFLRQLHIVDESKLGIIGDSLAGVEWHPKLKHSHTKENLKRLYRSRFKNLVFARTSRK